MSQWENPSLGRTRVSSLCPLNPELQDSPTHLQTMVLCHNVRKLGDPVAWVRFPKPFCSKETFWGVEDILLQHSPG